MSSFPNHEDNIRALEKMKFDVSEALVNGEVTMESWGYDELVDLMGDVIRTLQSCEFEVSPMWRKLK